MIPLLHAHELVFSLLRQLRQLFPADVDPVEVLDGKGRGHLERRGGGKARALGNVPVDRDVHAAQRVARAP